jgi:hypothetical protein
MCVALRCILHSDTMTKRVFREGISLIPDKCAEIWIRRGRGFPFGSSFVVDKNLPIPSVFNGCEIGCAKSHPD